MDSGGRFEILELLGAGTLGRLYRARDARLGRTVALRIVATPIAEDPPAREALLAAARKAASFSHPHAADLLDIVFIRHAHEIVCLVHELAEGQLLSAMLAGGAVAPLRALALASQVAEALAAGAEAGVHHGAVDPGGIVVSATGQATVLDFGVSAWTSCARARARAGRILEADDSVVADRPSALYYVSPEQLLGVASDGRADIFALGGILHEMLTGRPAFSGESEAALALQILQANPAPPSRLNPAVPPAADGIVLRALAKSLDQRYSTAADLAADLRRILAEPALELVPKSAAPDALFEPRCEAPRPEPAFSGFFDRPEEPAEAAERDGVAASENQNDPVPPLLLQLPAAGQGRVSPPKARVGRLSEPPTRHERTTVRPAVWGMVAAAAVIVLLAGVAWFGRNALDLPWQDRVTAAARPYVMVTSFAVAGDDAPPYFGPGFAEDLAARLSEVPGAIVVGRTSLRQTPFVSDWRARANRVGAMFVVRGTIKPGPYALHADAELLDAASGASIWSQHFTREPRQIAALQAEIAGELAQRLRLVTPTTNRWARASVRKTDPAAYDLYLQGREAAEKRDRARAIGLYDQALQRDPGLIEARAALSQAIYLEEYYAGVTRDAASSGRALREAEAALAVDAELPAAHLAAALAAPTTTMAASSLARALSSDPSNGEAWHHAGDLVNELDPPRSIPFYRNSLALEPSIDANWRDLASAYASAGSFDAARDAIDKGQAARPDRPWWTQMRARLDVEQGRYDVAIQALGGDPSVETSPIVWLMGRVVPMAMAGRAVDARREASRLVERYPAYCEGGAVLAAIELESGAAEQGRQRAEAILSAASRPDAAPAMKVCAALAAAGTGDPAEAASWMARLAGDERALRLWTRQAVFGPALSFRSRWYPWNKVAASQPMQVATGQLNESLQRVRGEIERRLPAPPGSNLPER